MNRDFSAKAEIDLKKLKNNLIKIKKHTSADICAVVKADAYGHGLRCALAVDNLASTFAVADVYEGITLRFMGITKPIYCLVPLTFKELLLAFDYELTVPIYSKKSLIEALYASKNSEKPISVLLKIDTGMNRFGFTCVEEFLSALNAIEKNKKVSLYGVYSHFYNAKEDFLCEKQFETFKPFYKKAKELKIKAHIAASGGFLKGGYDLDEVRIGLLMYGYKPFECNYEVEKVMKITAEPIEVKKLKGGENCFYGCKVDCSCRAAVVRYGYFNGLFKNKKGSLVADRCMNVSAVKANDKKVVLMDDAEKLASLYSTSVYEVLVKSAIGLERIYYGE